MRFQDFSDLSKRNFQAGLDNEREYELSTGVSLLVDFAARYGSRIEDFQFDVAIGIADHSARPVRLNDLQPQTLVKFAEIKAMVDQWKAGTIDELPPSTCTKARDAMRALNERQATLWGSDVFGPLTHPTIIE